MKRKQGGLSPQSEQRVAEGLAADVRAAVTRCRARDYNEEGIPMFLVLEDLTGAESVPPASGGLHDALLAAAAELVLDSLADGEVGPAEIAMTFEVLASQLFTLGTAELPAAPAEGG